mmetsp:Transcript_74928/g.229268  ORF Transcript_74928/g.229268 Transcript_74928/m.229268 type:complete len:237 (+) Transcript_74928:1010-1720(+)
MGGPRRSKRIVATRPALGAPQRMARSRSIATPVWRTGRLVGTTRRRSFAARKQASRATLTIATRSPSRLGPPQSRVGAATRRSSGAKPWTRNCSTATRGSPIGRRAGPPARNIIVARSRAGLATSTIVGQPPATPYTRHRAWRRPPSARTRPCGHHKSLSGVARTTRSDAPPRRPCATIAALARGIGRTRGQRARNPSVVAKAGRFASLTIATQASFRGGPRRRCSGAARTKTWAA